MSKSLGNLVFVSRLVADGVDPMAIRLAIMSHHYRDDWDWTAAGLAAAQDRLAHWRAALRRAGSAGGTPAGSAEWSATGPAASEPGSVATGGGVPSEDGMPSGEAVLAALRERIADDLDAPGALDVVDRWAGAALTAPELPPGPGAGTLVRDTVDALLGIAL